MYTVINDVLRSGKCVDIQVYDLVKAFDVLWLADTLNDMWDTLPENARDNKLGLVYQLNLSNLVAVNTAVGQTDRFNIPEGAHEGHSNVQILSIKLGSMRFKTVTYSSIKMLLGFYL